MITGLNMEQHSHPDIPPMNPVPTFEPYDNNGLPQYHHHHHHQGASDLGPGMSAPTNLYLPYVPFHAHPLAHGSHDAVTSTAVHESNPHFMGHGYKRKSAEVIPGSYQYLTETAPLSLPHYGTTYPQPIDQRSVRSRVGEVSMDPPPYSHGHNSFIHGNYTPLRYDQHCNNNLYDGTSSLWPQPPSRPYMHGNVVTDSGNVCFPRYHEASSSRNDIPFVNPSPYYFSHHLAPPPPPPPTLYPHMASASYTVPMAIHDSHVRPVQSTGFRINQQYPRDYDFLPAATLRHHGLPHLSAIPAYEDEDFEEGDYYDDVDHHEDMRLDIEDMSYEELLALSDHIGTVKTGLSEETVKDLVKRRTSISTRINLEEAPPPSTDLETDSCTICQESYKNQEKIVTLDCKHEYHAECLEKWLVIKNLCPICKSEALVMDKNKER